MAEFSGISWTKSTWNPWRGCQKVSDGCKLCYADTQSHQNPKTLGVWGPPGVGTRVVGAEAYWRQPVKWDAIAARTGEPWRVFCASFADVFEDWDGPMETTDGVQLWKRVDHGNEWTASDHYRDTVALTMADVRARVFQVMEATPHLTWLVLTKRPQNIRGMVPPAWLGPDGWPAHVWPGATAEDQPNAQRRVPELLNVPAAVRWLSVEPQLGDVVFREHYADGSGYRDWLTGQFCGLPVRFDSGQVGTVSTDDARLPRIHWVITGGESGHGARPYRLEWARSVVRQCQAAGTAVFVKQMGAAPSLPMDLTTHPHDVTLPLRINDAAGRIELKLIDKKGGNPDEWPADLRIQEFPPCHPPTPATGR